MPRIPLVVLLSLLAGCHADYALVVVDEPLSLELTSPSYGAFLGDDPAWVEGRVWPSDAVLTVEGATVVPDAATGAFALSVPLDGPWIVVDVVAERGEERLRERVPLFAGHAPADTWPGGASARLTPEGLRILGEQVGAMVDATGWAESLSGSLPSLDWDWIALLPTGITHDPTVVVLEPAEGGVDVALAFRNLTLGYELVVWDSWTAPLSMGFGEIAVGSLAEPAVDAEGMVTLTLTDATVVMDDPDIVAGDLEGEILEWVIEALNEYVVEPLGELLLDYVLDNFGTIELGGPFAFETELAGLSLAAALVDVEGDLEGLAAGIAMGLGAPLPEEPGAVEAPGVDEAPEAQAAFGLHEYVLDLAISGQVLDLLDQEISLGGTFGEIIGAAARNLPGGDDAPDGDGWCMAVDPGTAHVVRLQEGLDPLAALYAPDVTVSVGILDGSRCEDWLVASLVLELGLAVEEGTRLGFDLDVPEGAVLSYGATGAWDEAEVVEGLGNMLSSFVSLLGGMVELDLAELFGSLDSGTLGIALEPRIVGSTPLVDQDGVWVEGLYAVSLDLFPE